MTTRLTDGIKRRLGMCNVGSVVEFSPATREARVRFPDVAGIFYFYHQYRYTKFSLNYENSTFRDFGGSFIFR